MPQPSASGTQSTINTDAVYRFSKHAAIFFPDFDGKIFACGRRLGLPGQHIKASAGIFSSAATDPCLGLRLSFPCQDGPRGARYTCKCNESPHRLFIHAIMFTDCVNCPDNPGLMRVEPATTHTVTVRFPRDITIETEVASEAMMTAWGFPQTTDFVLGCTKVRVLLNNDANVKVGGFGIPFFNPEHPEIEGWVNNNLAIMDGITLGNFLAQRVFSFVMAGPYPRVSVDFAVPMFGPAFTYGFGSTHTYDEDRYHQAFLNNNATKELLAAYKYALCTKPQTGAPGPPRVLLIT